MKLVIRRKKNERDNSDRDFIWLPLFFSPRITSIWTGNRNRNYTDFPHTEYAFTHCGLSVWCPPPPTPPPSPINSMVFFLIPSTHLLILYSFFCSYFSFCHPSPSPSIFSVFLHFPHIFVFPSLTSTSLPASFFFSFCCFDFQLQRLLLISFPVAAEESCLQLTGINKCNSFAVKKKKGKKICLSFVHFSHNPVYPKNWTKKKFSLLLAVAKRKEEKNDLLSLFFIFK